LVCLLLNRFRYLFTGSSFHISEREFFLIFPGLVDLQAHHLGHLQDRHLRLSAEFNKILHFCSSLLKGLSNPLYFTQPFIRKGVQREINNTNACVKDLPPRAEVEVVTFSEDLVKAKGLRWSYCAHSFSHCHVFKGSKKLRLDPKRTNCLPVGKIDQASRGKTALSPLPRYPAAVNMKGFGLHSRSQLE